MSWLKKPSTTPGVQNLCWAWPTWMHAIHWNSYARPMGQFNRVCGPHVGPEEVLNFHFSFLTLLLGFFDLASQFHLEALIFEIVFLYMSIVEY